MHDTINREIVACCRGLKDPEGAKKRMESKERAARWKLQLFTQFTWQATCSHFFQFSLHRVKILITIFQRCWNNTRRRGDAVAGAKNRYFIIHTYITNTFGHNPNICRAASSIGNTEFLSVTDFFPLKGGEPNIFRYFYCFFLSVILQNYTNQVIISYCEV